jgi:uncharacterized protein YecE (DUF72 family)
MRESADTGALRVGCSGWSYKDWRGIVYPADIPQRRWFEHYQSLFDTVELNSTFYRLPTPTAVENWAQAAAGFPLCRQARCLRVASHEAA